MSVTAKKYTWGVKVYLQQALTEDTDIGLYVENFGAASTQIDITNPSGTTFRYTWDGTGTDPDFLTNGMNIGDMVVINSTNFNAANNGTFRVTASTDGYFEITNAVGVAENNKTLGSTTAIKSAHQFRWIQNTVTTTKTWKQGILVDRAIAPIEQEADFMTTGNPAQVRGTTISFKNIDGTAPLWKTLVDGGINIIGKKVQIIEFDHSTTPATETVLGTYIFDGAPKWSESDISVNAVSAYYKRDILIGELVDNDAVNGNYPFASNGLNGTLVPATYGEIRPLDDGAENYAKAVGVASDESAWVSSDSAAIVDCLPANISTYSVSSKTTISGTTTIVFKCGSSVVSIDDTILASELVGQYVKCVLADDGGVTDFESVGKYRLITNAYGTISPNNLIAIEISSDFPDPIWPTNNIVWPNGIRTFIRIIQGKKQYALDTWKLHGPIKSNGDAVVSRPESYNYDNVFVRIPDAAFSLLSTTDKNEIYLTDTTIDDSLSTVKTGIIESFTSAVKADDILYELDDGYTINKIGDGLYRTLYTSGFSITSDDNNMTNMLDGDGSTKHETIFTTTNNSYNYKILRFTCPPIDYSFSKIYFCAALNISVFGPAAVGLGYYASITLRINLYDGTHIFYWANSPVSIPGQFHVVASGAGPTGCGITFRNLPTWAYSANAIGTDAVYTQDVDDGAGTVQGKNMLVIEIGDIENVDIYNSITSIDLIMGTAADVNGVTNTTTISVFEAALALETEATLGRDIYTPFKGRIYDDTWGARKTAVDLIESPVDILEHALRLQNWNDRDSGVSFGRAYSPNALINTASTETGFDYAGLDDLRTIKAARQILDEGEATTGSVVDSLCKQFDLCSFQSNTGSECVNSILPSAVARDVVLSLNDIMPDSISDFEEIAPQYIYCEPYVQYAYNSATNKYDGIIKVTNASADTFSAAYVSGYTGSEAETIWKMAHALYLRYGIVTEPPSERTELKWIRRTEDAKKILINWLQHMGATTTDGSTYRAANRRRFSFRVPYEKAMTIGATHTPWYISMKFDIVLPHQTANVQLQCMVEKIRFDIYGGTVDITAICYDIASEIQFYVKNTYGSSSPGLDDWKDTYQTQAEAPTNGNDIKNNY